MDSLTNFKLRSSINDVMGAKDFVTTSLCPKNYDNEGGMREGQQLSYNA